MCFPLIHALNYYNICSCRFLPFHENRRPRRSACVMVVCLLLNLGFKAAFEFKCKVVVVDCDDIFVRWHSIPSQINPGGNTMDLTAYASFSCNRILVKLPKTAFCRSIPDSGNLDNPGRSWTMTGNAGVLFYLRIYTGLPGVSP